MLSEKVIYNLEKRSYTKVDDKWKLEKKETSEATREEFDKATCLDTRKWFERVLGGKETLSQTKNGWKLTSISPNGTVKSVRLYTLISSSVKAKKEL